jgi:hypothetical protein
MELKKKPMNAAGMNDDLKEKSFCFSFRVAAFLLCG